MGEEQQRVGRLAFFPAEIRSSDLGHEQSQKQNATREKKSTRKCETPACNASEKKQVWTLLNRKGGGTTGATQR